MSDSILKGKYKQNLLYISRLCSMWVRWQSTACARILTNYFFPHTHLFGPL